MFLKRLLIVCLGVATLLISYFSFYFNLPYIAIPIHLNILAYGMLMLISFCLLFQKIFQKWIALLIIPVIVASALVFLVIIYSGYYIGMQNWGHPLTLKIALIYSEEIPELIQTVPFSNTLFAIILFLPATLIFGSLFLNATRLLNNLEVLNQNMRLNLKILILCVITIWSAPFAILNLPKIKIKFTKVLGYQFEPLGAFFFYKPHRAIITSLGNEYRELISEYPVETNFDKKNVILIVCDALRSDHFSFVGYPRKTSPFLDSLSNSKNVIWMEQFYSTCSRSFVAISNILSGYNKISYQNLFIHDILKKQGYNIQFLLSGDHTNFFGLKTHYGPNIDYYSDGFTSTRQSKLDRSMNNDLNLLDQLEMVEAFNGTPVFMFLHFMSAHQLGSIEEPFIKYVPQKFESIFSTNSQILTNNYDNKISQLDEYLRRCFEILKEKNLLQNSILIITSDHGQALLENGKYWHGKSTYYNEINVPFLLYFEDSTNVKKLKFIEYGNILDLVPTVLDLLELPIPKSCEGQSLFDTQPLAFKYQEENGYYSSIWSEDEHVFQYIYNSNDQKEEIFDFTSPNKFFGNLITSFGDEKIDELRSDLESHFNIKILID